MSNYPISIDLSKRRCVVIGGGLVAERKARMLLRFGANLRVAAPQLSPGIAELLYSGSIEYNQTAYRPELLDGAFLVIAATDDRETNRAVSIDAQNLGILVNVVDDPELCTFFVPAVVKRDDLIVSVSTSGKCPALAHRIREELESSMGPEYGDLVELLAELRNEIRLKHADPTERNSAYQRILDSEVLELLSEGRQNEAIERARECI